MLSFDAEHRLKAFSLALFLGMFGVHRFWLGRIGTGIAMLVLTLTVVLSFISLIWVVVDALRIAFGSLDRK